MGLSGLGNLLLAFASVGALGSIVAIAFGGRSEAGEPARKLGHVLTFGILAFTTLAITLLAAAFLGENFALEYVAYNHPTLVGAWSWLYKLSGVWAGREGSLLFWEWILSMYAAWIAYRFLKKDDPLASTALGIVNFVQLFFLAALFIPLNNPFKLLPPEYLDPNTGALLIEAAMNPLLQTWAMIAHPPTLFIGYAGLTVPFAFALAAAFTGDLSKKWVEYSDRITVFSWLLLGIGIGLGAIWAYIELAFGGYWAWDPGLIHSMTVYKKRGGFRPWTMWMAAVTFVLVLLGTFITRSGIVQSVHAFQEDPLSFWLFLTMMVGSLAIMGVAIAMRWNALKGNDSFERILSKEGSYYFNNVIMLIAAVLVAYLTLAQSLPSWLPGGGMTFGAATYDSLARPLGIFYVLVMAICPILAWGGGDIKVLWQRAKWPLVGAAVISAGLVAIFFTNLLPNYTQSGSANPVMHHTVAIIGLITAALAIALPLFLFYDGARKRAAARGEGFGTALANIFLKARVQSGGYLTHLGMGIILIGLIGSTMYVKSFDATMAQTPGTSYDAGAYRFTAKGLQESTEPNGDAVYTFALDVTKNGRSLGEIRPRMVARTGEQSQTTQKVALIQEPLKDVFVSFSGVDQASQAVVTIKFFPMQWWVWAGFIVTILGSGLASWPKRELKAA